jgi:hypothetical protein
MQVYDEVLSKFRLIVGRTRDFYFLSILKAWVQTLFLAP